MMLNTLRGESLEYSISHVGMGTAAARVARSSGFGDAVDHARHVKRAARAKGKASRAARRRNR